MLELLQYWWLWVVGGSILLLWGYLDTALTGRQWLRLLFSLSWIFYTEPTQREKQVSKHTGGQEVAAANPGCTLMVLGLGSILYGLCRWIFQR